MTITIEIRDEVAAAPGAPGQDFARAALEA